MNIGKTIGYVALIGAGFLGGMTYSTQQQKTLDAKNPYRLVVKDQTQFTLDKSAQREIETGKLFKLYYAVEGVFDAKAKHGSALEEMLK